MGNSTYSNEDQLKQIVRSLSTSPTSGLMCHMHLAAEPLPQPATIKKFIMLCRGVLFPGYFGHEDVNSYNLEYHIGLKCENIMSILESQVAASLSLEAGCGCDRPSAQQLHERARSIAADFMQQLPNLRDTLNTDVQAILDGDPAVTTSTEVIYCYPGIKAISNYRIAHVLYEHKVPVLPRMITEMAHSETGIDIHPGAQIGSHFSIDHGTGVVIGATAIIGNNVKLYQGVTLGARSFDLDENGNPVKGVPRHPIVGNDVIVYSNASLLGRIHIGDGAIIGGNIWVTTDVAPGERLIQAKANNIVRLKINE